MDLNRDFWADRRILLTGHTGFKGSWLAIWLESLGARVTGLALEPEGQPNLFEALEPWSQLDSRMGDVRSHADVAGAIEQSKPEIVIHMAAQSLVRAGYEDPVLTFDTNVSGTARLLGSIVGQPCVRAILVVTSDKVYAQGASLGRPFVESDRLGGRDPYSASKVCQEFVASSISASYFGGTSTRLGTARAGNVIGGGDWGLDRLIPDLVRAWSEAKPLVLRYPNATRPWQHVLDCLSGYLAYIEALLDGSDPPKTLNFGPLPGMTTKVSAVVEVLAELMSSSVGWTTIDSPVWSEMPALELNSQAARDELGWRPKLALEAALSWTADWYLAFEANQDMRAFSLAQIKQYEELLADG